MHDMEKVFALHTIKELLKINKENTNNPIEKWAKMITRQITEEGNKNGQ